GVRVVAFVDRSVKEDEHLPVYTLEGIPKAIISEDIIVIVCLSNGMYHGEVAKNLAELGFENICFLPLETQSPVSSEMTLAYNDLLESEYPLPLRFPTYSALSARKLLPEESVIFSTPDDFTVWVHHSL